MLWRILAFIVVFPLSALANVGPYGPTASTVALFSYVGNEVNSKGNSNGSTIHSDSQPGYALRVARVHPLTDWVSISGGLSFDYIQLRITHTVGRKSADFSDTLLLIGLPLGVEVSPFYSENLYFPVTMVPKFKIKEDVTVNRCKELCKAEPSANPTTLFGEIGAGWRQDAWDFQVSFSQALSDQFEGGVTDLRMSGLRASAGYRW